MKTNANLSSRDQKTLANILTNNANMRGAYIHTLNFTLAERSRLQYNQAYNLLRGQKIF